MTQLRKCNSKEELEEFDDYGISENCNWCNKEMTNIKYIWIDRDSDRYCCSDCIDEYGINAVRVKEYY